MQFKQEKLWPKITKLVIFVVVFWIIFLLGQSLWQNWFLQKSILKLKEQLAYLEQQKKDLNNLNLYYRSDAFRELEARKRLGLKKPGEKMVILPASPSATATPNVETSPTNFPEELNKEKEAVAGIVTPSKIPNWLLWWQYFTK